MTSYLYLKILLLYILNTRDGSASKAFSFFKIKNKIDQLYDDCEIKIKLPKKYRERNNFTYSDD